jgi:predicted Zn-dependent protease
MDGRQTSTRSAAIALGFWLVLVVGVMAWWRPRFWDEPHERFQRAQALAREGRPSEALAVVDDALTGRPTDTGFLVFKGHRQLDLNQPAEAERTFRQALAQDPSNVDATLGFAAALGRTRARSAALRTLQALPPAALSESQMRRRSQLYAALNAPLLALEDLSQLLHARPHDAELLKEAALHARSVKDWQQTATLAFRVAAATSDASVRAWAHETRAEALEAAGAPTEALAAVEHYQELVRLRPHEPHLRRSLARALLTTGRRAEAEEVFRALIADAGADRQTRIEYAWMLNTERRYAEAWNVIEPLPRPDRDPDVLELQARTALWAGRAHEAVQLLSALLELRPQRAELWKRLAESWHALGDDRQAAGALAAYVRLNAQDADARQQLADMLAASQSIEAAIEHYRGLVAADTSNPALLRRLGLLQETAGDLEAAKTTYRDAVSASGQEVGDLYLRLARIHRWTKDPAGAVAWYEKHIAREQNAVLRGQAESELALALLDAGDSKASLAHLNASASRRPLDAGELLVAARAAQAMNDSAATARFLARLGERRPLTIDEETWLAGAYRAAGRAADALAAYVSVAGRTPSPSVEVIEGIGDLRYDSGEFAGALDAFDRIPDAPTTSLKRARAAARLGRLADAGAAYDRYLRQRPDDAAIQLEAARHHAATGAPRLAIEHYNAVLAARGAADLRLELARVYLAAERYADAEAWARQAVAAGEDQEESRLALAQSLYLQGRVRQAETVLASDAKPAGETLVWRSRVASALDRHLDAYQSAQRALAAGAQPRDRLLLWMASAARRRGDYGRAHAAIAGVSPRSTTGPELAAVRKELNADTSLAFAIPAWVHSDTNDLRLTGGGARVVLFLPSRLASVAFGASAGTVSQRSFSSQRTSATVTIGNIFPVPELELTLGAGVDRYDRAGDLFTWRAQGIYYRRGGSLAGLSVAREALLPLAGETLRQFNRALDIGLIGPAFHLHALRGFIDTITGEARRLRAEFGLDAFEDGNRRVSSYLHYQIPIASDARHWVALRPNLYFETFRDARAAYFSPDRHLTTGLMLHGIRRYPRWYAELELNPQWLRTSGADGFGVHALLGAGATLGRVSFSAGAFVFYDGLEDYLQRRVAGAITIPVGRR